MTAALSSVPILKCSGQSYLIQNLICAAANSLGASDDDMLYDVKFMVQNSAGEELGKAQYGS
jgi:hypothetical protein